MSVGDMALDPAHPDQLWFAEGIGVWRTSVDAESDGDPSLVYASRSAGIEQLVANQIIAPPGGKPLLASWDRPVFRIDDPNRYPSRHGPNNDHAIVMGWALDYAASEPNYVAGLFNWWGVEASAFSRDGGRTWTPFPSYPPLTSAGKIGGSLAVSSPLNLVWTPSNNGRPYYTRDGGATWLPADVPGVPTSGDTGWGFAYFLNRHIVAADRVAPGTFYLYNTPRGLYRSTDGGASWTLVHPGEIAPWSGTNAELLTMPGQAGRLFFTSGPQGGARDFHPARNPLMRSVDGGKTWTPVPGVLEVALHRLRQRNRRLSRDPDRGLGQRQIRRLALGGRRRHLDAGRRSSARNIESHRRHIGRRRRSHPSLCRFSRRRLRHIRRG